MPQTDRSKRPKCRWCGRTIVKGMVEVHRRPFTWRHKHTGKVECTRQPVVFTLQVSPRVATPPEGFEVSST